MSTEENKELVRRGLAAMTSGNLDQLSEILAPDVVNYSFPDARGREAFLQVMGMFLTAFPDMIMHMEDSIAEGDKVATRGYFTGTHMGNIMGIPATGKSVKVSYTDIWAIKDGKAAENWVQMDTLGMMQQLGVAPSQ
jgi:steroid delta-isomerase-like uncharacterized protein